ncbi:unnamed protein product [Amoebophrya sp. A25]|nr:unnamed protein product [Amoebophrya sp. A25]|eukprot:GSA25T00024167001.1
MPSRLRCSTCTQDDIAVGNMMKTEGACVVFSRSVHGLLLLHKHNFVPQALLLLRKVVVSKVLPFRLQTPRFHCCCYDMH